MLRRDKATEQQRRITALEGDNMELRAEVESLRMRCEELEALNENQSELEVELQGDEERGGGNIVKVIRSHIQS